MQAVDLVGATRYERDAGMYGRVGFKKIMPNAEPEIPFRLALGDRVADGYCRAVSARSPGPVGLPVRSLRWAPGRRSAETHKSSLKRKRSLLSFKYP